MTLEVSDVVWPRGRGLANPVSGPNCQPVPAGIQGAHALPEDPTPRRTALLLMGIVTLIEHGRVQRTVSNCTGLRPDLDARLLLPDPRCLGKRASMIRSCQQTTSWMEVAVDDAVGRQETRHLLERLEALHLPLAPAHGPVRVLGAMVEVAVLAVPDFRRDARGARRRSHQGRTLSQDTITPLPASSSSTPRRR